MERYFKRIPPKWCDENPPQNPIDTGNHIDSTNNDATRNELPNNFSQNVRVSDDIKTLPSDPTKRIPILNYHTNDRDIIRRAYLLRNPTQPREYFFPYKNFSGVNRRFNAKWFGDQDIVKAILLVGTCKERLQVLGDEKFQSTMDDVKSYCVKHDIVILTMDMHVIRGKLRRRVSKGTNEHYYRVECFYTIIDMVLQEIKSRFSELNTDLLHGVTCFYPIGSFSKFDKKKLIRMAQLYPNEFFEVEISALDIQLENFIVDMRREESFFELRGISDFQERWWKPRNTIVFPYVVTATVERAFSAMKFIKNEKRNKIGDQFLND